MIDQEKLRGIVEQEIEDKDLFVVEINVSPSNAISVVVDGMNGVPISTCVALSRSIEKQFDRDVEDFELCVSSAGIGQAFQVFQQYEKNVGKRVEVITKDGMKHTGRLVAVKNNGIEIEEEQQQTEKRKKTKPVVVKHSHFTFNEIKLTRDIVTF